MMDLQNYLTLTKDLGIYGTIKKISQKHIKEHYKNLKSSRLESRLISVAYETLLTHYSYFDLEAEELHVALMIEASFLYHNENNWNSEKFETFKNLLVKLQSFSVSSWYPNDILKILLLLHCNFVRSNSIGGAYTKELVKNEKIIGPRNVNRIWKVWNPEIVIRKTWESFTAANLIIKEPVINVLNIECNRIMKNDLSASQMQIYVSREELHTHIISALVGEPSSSFMKKDSCLMIMEGLYTEGISADVLKELIMPILKCGKCYLTLSELQNEDFSSTCNLAIFSSLKHFLDLYYRVVLELPQTNSITSWLKYLTPLFQQIEFITSCLTPLSDSTKLLEKLYYFTIHDISRPNVSLMVRSLLFDCCQAYFNLIDCWVFEGTWHKDLFIKKNSELKDISSKEAWINAFSFVQEDAPKFLPCLDIYTCGRNVALLKICSESDLFVHTVLSEQSRPQIRLCTSSAELNRLDEECKEYNANKTVEYEPTKLHQKKSNIEDFFIVTSVKDKSIKTNCSITDKEFTSEKIPMANYCRKYSPDKYSKVKSKELSTSLDSSKNNFFHSHSDSDDIKISDFKKRLEKMYEEHEIRSKHLSWRQSRSRQNVIREHFLREIYELCGAETFLDKSCYDSLNRIFLMVMNKAQNHPKIPFTPDAGNSSVLFGTNALIKELNQLTSDITVYEELVENRTGTELGSDSSDLIFADNVHCSVQSSSVHKGVIYNEKCLSSKDFEDNNNEVLQNPDELLTEEQQETAKEKSDTAELKSFEVNSHTENVNVLQRDVDELYLKTLELKSKILFRYDIPITKGGAYEALQDSSFDSGKYTEEIIPVRDMITSSIIIPLRMQQKLVNDELIRVFMIENKYLQCAQALTDKFFLMDGLFSLRLIDSLCKSIEVEAPFKFLSFNRLNRILDIASDSSDNNVSFKINFIPAVFELNDPQVFSCVSLTYRVKWPLNFLITPTMITKYDSVFSFLVTLERSFWKLKHLFVMLKMNSVDASGPQYRELQLHRFIMTQYVSSLKAYIQNVVIDDNWNKFLKEVHCIKDIETLYRTHANLVKKVRFMCFLGKGTTKLFDTIMKLLRFILVYCRIAITGEWTLSDSNVFTHGKFPKLNHYFSGFVQLARFIVAWVEKLVDRGYQTELDGLLQILTVNSFYLPL